MHMYDAESRAWSATPPSYPCIGIGSIGCFHDHDDSTNKGSNLSRYTDMNMNNNMEENDAVYGTMVDSVAELMRYFNE